MCVHWPAGVILAECLLAWACSWVLRLGGWGFRSLWTCHSRCVSLFRGLSRKPVKAVGTEGVAGGRDTQACLCRDGGGEGRVWVDRLQALRLCTQERVWLPSRVSAES